jgi:uncharacterized protein (UPF0332 family)
LSTVADSTEPSAFEWLDFVELAHCLAERGDEASLRSSVSRGYYAVFHLAQVALTRHDPDFDQHRGSDSHKLVWDRLAALKRNYPQAANAARNGRTLADRRKKADYKITAGDWPKQSKDALVEVTRAVAALTKLLA